MTGLNPQQATVIEKVATRHRLSDAAKTDALRAVVHAARPMPRHAVLEEVADRTGFANRYCDALAVALWPSDRLRMDGFELKASRGDWKKELGDPTKAHRFAAHCTRWYLVTYGDIATREEIPDGWGWWVYDGEKVAQRVKPRRNPAPAPVPRDMIAALIRRAVEAGPCLGTLATMVSDVARSAARREYRLEESLRSAKDRNIRLDRAVLLLTGHQPTYNDERNRQVVDEILREKGLQNRRV